jgi:hypothetical protein
MTVEEGDVRATTGSNIHGMLTSVVIYVLIERNGRRKTDKKWTGEK